MAKHIIKVLVAPHVTEKATMLSAKNQYVFKIHKTANKAQVKAAVEKEFNVKVAAVRTVNTLGKERKSGAITGRRSDWKKAYISLMDGFAITLPEPETVKD
ncbi:MAG TPA: 50S ribosomal protein L23 [Gammaproteobacteria bacterium]|nr:50S ribosomal protein L23 [Gammaproteobacteria bacterium]